MNISKKILTIIGFVIVSTAIIASPVFATIQECLDEFYPELSTVESDIYPIKCVSIKDKETDEYVRIYAKTSADCAKASTIASGGCDKGKKEEAPVESGKTKNSDFKEEPMTELPKKHNGAIMATAIVGTVMGLIILATIIICVRHAIKTKKQMPEIIDTLKRPTDESEFYMVEQPQDPQKPQNPQQ